MENNKHYIFGKNSIIEAIKSKVEIEKIYLRYGINNDFIKQIAKKNNIHCTALDRTHFKTLETNVCSPNVNTQGVIALKSIIKTLSLEDFIGKLDIKKNPIIVILDKITDPQNFGAIARSCECAGVDGLILPINDSVVINPTAIKTSAGALQHIKIIKAKNLINTCEKLKEKGFWIIGSAVDGEKEYTDNIYDIPIAIIIGSEGSGMSPSLRKHCDHLIRIEMLGKINSLNASVSTGVILFEIQRQKKINK